VLQSPSEPHNDGRLSCHAKRGGFTIECAEHGVTKIEATSNSELFIELYLFLR
jgi:hypothetical protein